MIKFIVDTQLPPSLSVWLERQGYESTHPFRLPQGVKMTDAEIIRYAVDHDCIIVSKDKDFLDHYLLRGAPPRIVMLHLGNISNKDLLAQFQVYLPRIVAEFESKADLLIVGTGKITRY